MNCTSSGPASCAKAETATADQRRKMAFDYYGLTARPGDDSSQPLQYVIDKAGTWHMNCFACHGGNVVGEVYPGAPTRSSPCKR